MYIYILIKKAKTETEPVKFAEYTVLICADLKGLLSYFSLTVCYIYFYVWDFFESDFRPDDHQLCTVSDCGSCLISRISGRLQLSRSRSDHW